ncbi:hypothetical protein [Geothrix sp. PMB-07]|uniref:hypothetical protein n=1 Tax=Geothrix sp. PMB-07 TaxID=3068640 RepID=UPI00274181FF|nr:hypothetical protein [Geothrix sp. PMB-07]WLT31217.1 hypothetical protein Q9293_15990 [Geothrix sp. PMB-07]
MRPLPWILAPAFLTAQAPGAMEAPTLDVRPQLGIDPAAQIQLVPAGSWAGLMLSVTTQPIHPPASRRRRVAEATVEVWDVAFRETPRQETFRLFREALIQSLRGIWRLAPPSHSRIDASIRAGNGSGAGTDTAMVQSLQQRFNSLPPNGSPVASGGGRYR